MKKGKKILYVITKSNWGGAQRYVYDLAVEANRGGYETVVVTGGNGLLLDKLREAGIQTIPLPEMQLNTRFISVLFSFKNIFIPFSLLRIYLQEKPDIVHLNSFKVGGLGALAGLWYKIITLNFNPKIIFTVHGWAFTEKRPFWQRVIIFLAAWISSLLQDQIILINNNDFGLAKKFIPKKKVELIFNGIKKPVFLPKDEAREFLLGHFSKNTTGAKEPSLLIGCIAELVKNKGLEYLLGAMRISSILDMRLIIFGEGEDRQKLQQRIKTYNLQGRVVLAGFMPKIVQYLKGMDVFVLPSLKEGLPYVIMEAMVAGIPVVATRVGGIPDLISHGNTGFLVPPGDSPSLAESLNLLKTKKESINKLSHAAEEKINKHFRLEHMIEKTFGVYEA